MGHLLLWGTGTFPFLNRQLAGETPILRTRHTVRSSLAHGELASWLKGWSLDVECPADQGEAPPVHDICASSAQLSC